ncbi:MAG: hypothetical protein AAF618_09370 [Pseudomonadota bacterium]
MYKRLTALVLSGAIALTSLAPTQAMANDREKIAKLVVGALVLYGLSEAAKNSRSSSSKSTKSYAPKHTYHAPKHTYHQPRHNYYQPHRPHRPVRSAPVRKSLPAGCILTHRQRYGETRTVFGNACLKNHYRGYYRMPQNCYRRFDTVKGPRVGWGRLCLRNAGYSW